MRIFNRHPGPLVVVATFLTLASLLAGAGWGQASEDAKSLRKTVEGTWGGCPTMRASFASPVRWDMPHWDIQPDGTVRIYGTDEQSVVCARRIVANRHLFTPVIERMVSEALEERRVWELCRLGRLLVGVVRTPRAAAIMARIYLGVHALLEVLPAELAAAERVEPWARRCGVGYWEEPITWRHRLGVMSNFCRVEGSSLRVLTDLEWRSERVLHAALETLARPPKILEVGPVDEPSGHRKFQDGLEAMHRGRMYAALEYLSVSYEGETRVRDALRDVCQDPQSAVAQIGVPDTYIRKALRRLGR